MQLDTRFSFFAGYFFFSRFAEIEHGFQGSSHMVQEGEGQDKEEGHVNCAEDVMRINIQEGKFAGEEELGYKQEEEQSGLPKMSFQVEHNGYGQKSLAAGNKHRTNLFAVQR